MWYSDIDLTTQKNYISSRIRLVRNIENYRFPHKLDKEKSIEATNFILDSLKKVPKPDEQAYTMLYLDKLSDIEKRAMREKRIINSFISKKETASGLIISENEDNCIVVNGDNHIRIQLISKGNNLKSLWEKADLWDNNISDKLDYAYNEKYGYLTTYPTNLGTGLRANIILHLPTLSLNKNFNNLLNGVSRFGVAMRGVYGEGRENHGSLYEIYNTKTLGISENEIIENVSRVAMQINYQEFQTRKLGLKEHRIVFTDEIYKSFGVLKYARKLSLKDAMIYLSALLQGEADELIAFDKPNRIYELMLNVQRFNIINRERGSLTKDEIEIARADYIRENLPKLIK